MPKLHCVRKKPCEKKCVGFTLVKPSSSNISGGGGSIGSVPIVIRDTVPSTDPLLRITNNTGSQTYFSVGPTETIIDGKLTVTGLIDPTGLVLTKQPIQPTNTNSTTGVLWIDDNDIAVETTIPNPTPTPGLLFSTTKQTYDPNTGITSLIDVKTPVVQSLGDVLSVGNVSTVDLVLGDNTSLVGKGSLNLSVMGSGDINLGADISVSGTNIVSSGNLGLNAANTGVVNIGSLSIDNNGNVENSTGDITFTPGPGSTVQVNNGLSIDGMASLNYYDEVFVTRTTDFGWTTGFSVDVKLTRIGNIVSLQLPTLLQPGIDDMTNKISIDSAIPLVYQPANNQKYPILISDDDTNKIGILEINVGVINIYVNPDLTTQWILSPTGISGFYGTSISWII